MSLERNSQPAAAVSIIVVTDRIWYYFFILIGQPTHFWNIGSRKRKLDSKFSPKKKKRIATWTHTFVCLSCTEDDMIPDSDYRTDLQLAGLGEQRVSLPGFADVHDNFSEISYLPQLLEWGAFELLRLPEGGGKHLDVIASPEKGYTTSYLRAVVHHANIYIRPLQKSLSLEPIKEEVSRAL